uniref:NADH-ubiquinone oxidoreductase chain 4 n=1 Tax=Ptenothrix huangshanensis TaxID=2583244 RepID=A0A6H0EW48_9HEXA|nr:NADH dehydrogenase subunit 4 [Ptenothrix huangshanensis]
MMALFFFTISLFFFNFSNWYMGVYILIMIFMFFMTMFPLNYEMILSFCYFDILSFSLIFLSIWLFYLMVMASFFSLIEKIKGSVYFFLMNFLLFSLVVSFSTNNLFMFYFFFECSLIPTLLMIMGWGYQPERLQASVYFLFYTLFGSLPLLLIMFLIYLNEGIFNFLMLSFLCFSSFEIFIFSLCIFSAFLIKMPMYLFHLWLPKAHVEAPVAGSMVLAGILLKLGGYGICRVMLMTETILKVLGYYIVSLSLVSMFYIGLQCCRLNDLKALVAYSSVAHMGMVLAGLFTFFMWGYSGSLMMMVSHGVVSSGLFCAVNLYYERISSRSLFLNKGEFLLIPGLNLFMFLLLVANIAAPPTINLESEIFLMFSLLSYSNFMMVFFPVGSFLGAVFTLYMYSFSQHGKNFSLMYSWLNVSSRECHVLISHLIPVNLFFMKSMSFLLF